MDRLTLKNLVFYGYHGVFAAEKELGQRFEVDVDMYGDYPGSRGIDDLETAVNYVDVYTLVKDIVEEREYNLVEALGAAIAEEIAGAFGIHKVTVRVRKPHAPIGGAMDYVEFETTRERPHT